MTENQNKLLVISVLRDILSNISYYPEEGDIWENEFKRAIENTAAHYQDTED